MIRDKVRQNLSCSAYVDGLVGIPYSDTGDDRRGCYCLGLAILVYRDAGAVVENPATMDPDLALSRMGSLDFVFIPGHAIREEVGDVLVMKADDGSQHLGLSTPFGVLHAHHSQGVALARKQAWGKLSIGLWRYRG